MGKKMPLAGTPKGDVYSFAIVLTEMYSRAEPYNLNDDEPEGMKAILRNNMEFNQ